MHGLNIEDRLAADRLWHDDRVDVLNDIWVAAVSDPRAIGKLTLKSDVWLNTKLTLVEAFDFGADMRSTSASDNLASCKVIQVLLSHHKAVVATISVAHSETRGISNEVLVYVDLLLARFEVVVVGRGRD